MEYSVYERHSKVPDKTDKKDSIESIVSRIDKEQYIKEGITKCELKQAKRDRAIKRRADNIASLEVVCEVVSRTKKEINRILNCEKNSSMKLILNEYLIYLDTNCDSFDYEGIKAFQKALYNSIKQYKEQYEEKPIVDSKIDECSFSGLISKIGSILALLIDDCFELDSKKQSHYISVFEFYWNYLLYLKKSNLTDDFCEIENVLSEFKTLVRA